MSKSLCIIVLLCVICQSWSFQTRTFASETRPGGASSSRSLEASSDPNGSRDFWIKQQALLDDLGAVADKSQRK